MVYYYGTSGFRFHHSIMKSIAEKVGEAVAILCSKYNSHYGIMITASHNPAQDNGVKLVNKNGEMITCEDETFMTNYVNSTISGEYVDNNERYTIIPEIYIGYDSRESSPELCKMIIQGIQNINKKAIIHNYEYISTPGLHYALYKGNYGLVSYIEYLASLESTLHNSRHIICDCANGIGSRILQNVRNFNKNRNIYTLVNTNTRHFEKLNHFCGSDFVVNNKVLPCKLEVRNHLYASLDGDADRIVFYYLNEQSKFQLLNGDKISALIAYYISKKLDDLTNVAVIHTGYSNQAFIEFIQSLGIKTYCTATGVKHLHKEALKHDISIYFESNGHGTVVFNKDYDELTDLQKYFHPTIGDGIMDMFAIFFIIQDLNISLDFWNSLYTDYPYELFKMEVANKDEFITTENQLHLIKPIKLQKYIDELCKSNVTAFVRPSGTENYLRVYIESTCPEKLKLIREKLEYYIQKNYMNQVCFEKNDKKFKIEDLCEDHYTSNYFHLLKQLTVIEPEKITKTAFDDFVNHLSNNHIVKIIKDEESKKIVGTITILIESKVIHNFGKVGHIEDVVVDESMRGFGLGKKLIEIATEECSECYKIILDCSDENKKFYEKCGFELKGNEMAIYL